MKKKKGYWERADLEKIQTQWNKVSGLHDRDEPSAAIVRAATAAELAANFAIRHEFATNSTFAGEVIDELLRLANGLRGKLEKLLLPLTKGQERHEKIKALQAGAKSVNDKRNSIVHRGEFCNAKEAETAIARSKEFIEALIRLYEPTFQLQDVRSRPAAQVAAAE